MELKAEFTHAFLGVIANRRPEMRHGVVVTPYVELQHIDKEHLRDVQKMLLTFSVGSTVRNQFLRVQGIQNCSLMTQFIDKNVDNTWWFECLDIFVQRKYLTRKGIVEILKRRPKVNNEKLRISWEEIMNTVMY